LPIIGSSWSSRDPAAGADGGRDNGLLSAALIPADELRADTGAIRSSTPEVLGGTDELRGGADDAYATGIGDPDARFGPPSAMYLKRYNPAAFTTNPSARANG
jgi:hypothetical protein